MDLPQATADTAFWISIAIILFLLILSGFFSGSETALTAASRGKLRTQADKGSAGAQRALKITEDNERRSPAENLRDHKCGARRSACIRPDQHRRAGICANGQHCPSFGAQHVADHGRSGGPG